MKTDIHKGDFRYKIKFRVGTTEYDYKINGVTGEVLDAKQNVLEEKLPGENKTFITKEKVLEIVLQHAKVTESEITEWECELENEKKDCHYEVEFKVGKNEYEYKVDAVTGEILESKADIEDEDRDDDEDCDDEDRDEDEDDDHDDEDDDRDDD